MDGDYQLSYERVPGTPCEQPSGSRFGSTHLERRLHHAQRRTDIAGCESIAINRVKDAADYSTTDFPSGCCTI